MSCACCSDGMASNPPTKAEASMRASASLNEPDSPPLCAEKEKMAAMIASVRIVLEATLRARMSTFLVSSARFMPSIISPEREYAKKSNNLLLQRAKVVYSVRILIWRTIARSSEHSEASWRGRACQRALVCLHLFLLSIPLAHGGMHVPTPHVYACASACSLYYREKERACSSKYYSSSYS